MYQFHKIYGLVFVFASLLLLAGCWQSNSSQDAAQKQLVIINVLDKADFDDCHITGSINIPFDAFESAMKTLHKQNHYVIYCADYMCMSSGFCAKLLKDAGFENVWAYEGGMAEWYQKGYPYEGPAQGEYLHGDNENLADEDSHAGVAVITAEELKARIEQFAV